jgi:hypothetical protein
MNELVFGENKKPLICAVCKKQLISTDIEEIKTHPHWRSVGSCESKPAHPHIRCPNWHLVACCPNGYN